MSALPTIPTPPAPSAPVVRPGGGPLKRFAGILSGRRETADGAYEFVLGVDDDGEAHEMTTGDYVEISQLVDLTGVDIVRADAVVYPQALVDPRVAWRGRIVVDGTLLVERDVSPEGDGGEDWTDFAAPVRNIVGPKTVTIRFEFVEV